MQTEAAAIPSERMQNEYTDEHAASQSSSSSRAPSPTTYFEDSLFSLFAHNQPAHGEPGDIRTYSHPNLPLRAAASRPGRQERGFRYGIPRNSATNHKLFAHFQWDAGLYLADMIAEQSSEAKATEEGVQDNSLRRDVSQTFIDVRGQSVVELGAGTGLPGLVACLMGADRTVLTDYPDDLILENLGQNLNTAIPGHLFAERTISARARIQVQGLEWGSAEQEARVLAATKQQDGFDIVLAADVLWVSSAHAALIQSIRTLLKRSAKARCTLVAGFHTGRPAVRRFFAHLALPCASRSGIVPDWEIKHGGIWERHVNGTERAVTTGWTLTKRDAQATTSNVAPDSDPSEEDMGDISDRSNWVVIASLRWADL